MTTTQGFELLRDQDIAELKIGARLYRHVKTGAEVLSISSDDENKVFGITFRTPPTDSTGVPHIMEHSVLCGSRKYPVKEPFVEILKGSLQTFLNAFTYPDKTCYPVASQNVQDFYNLIDVYLDAVFYPRLTPFTLQQEGWHYELNSTDDPLTYKGVVFNEMKGAYSSPDSLLAEHSQQSLFPDITYGLDSGGHPKVIPQLTFDQFMDFHQTYYHPSNSRIFFYGDDDPDERLHILDTYLRDFEKIDVRSQIPLQQPFESPRNIVHPFAVGEGETSSKGMVTVNWLLAETGDPTMNMALAILNHVLLEMPGSPLRKALIDSGLGEDIAGGGLESELRQMFFSVGLKGIDVADARRVETLIIDTFEGLAKEGLDPRAVEAAVNTTEFRLREYNTGRFPRGLTLMLTALTTWLYNGDPLALLPFEETLESIKSNIATGDRYLEGIVDRHFLHNLHRTTVVLTPDPTLGEREEGDERQRLETIRRAMADGDIAQIVADTQKLKEIQERPDAHEALATIPTLNREDLARENKHIPRMVLAEGGPTILYHDLFTNGILYLDIGFDLHRLPQQYIPYVPLFSRALIEMGTEKEDYVKISQRIGRTTGGIHSSILTSMIRESGATEARLFLRGKAVLSRVPDLMDILTDLLFSPRMDNRERFKQMVLEEKARQEQSVIPGGHQVVNLRLRSHFSESGWAAEQMDGVSYLFFLRDLVTKMDREWSSIAAALQDMLHLLLDRDSMIVNATIDGGGWTGARNDIDTFLEKFPRGDTDRVEWTPQCPPDFEGMTLPAQVNYVGKGMDLYRLGYRFTGSTGVITRYLRTSWLWDRVRVRGGAYGSFCNFDHLSGILTFLSYRDPNLLETLDVFDGTAEFLEGVDIDDRELTKCIIGAIGDIDTYLLPDAKGYTSMIRYLTGTSDAYLQQIRDEILSTTVDDFRIFAEVLRRARTEGLIKVLGSKSAIDRAVTERGLPLSVFEIL